MDVLYPKLFVVVGIAAPVTTSLNHRSRATLVNRICVSYTRSMSYIVPLYLPSIHGDKETSLNRFNANPLHESSVK